MTKVRNEHVTLLHEYVFHMSDILTTSLAVLQPLQQIHPSTMHSHTRHPLLPLPRTFSP